MCACAYRGTGGTWVLFNGTNCEVATQTRLQLQTHAELCMHFTLRCQFSTFSHSSTADEVLDECCTNIYMHEHHISLIKQAWMLCKVKVMQDVFRPIPGLLSCARVTGRWGLLYHARLNLTTFSASVQATENHKQHDKKI